MSEKKSIEKSRYFTFLLYPESLPENWIDKLESLGVAMAISPLHNKDKSEVQGQEFKKEHFHVIYVAKNPVTAESVRLKIKRLLGDKVINLVQIIHTSVENAYLYLTHESKEAIRKNKYVYNKSDITIINNFDIDRYISYDVETKEELFDILCKLIIKYQIANIFELTDFIFKYGESVGISNLKVLNKIILNKTTLLKLYFDGAYQVRKNGLKKINLD